MKKNAYDEMFDNEMSHAWYIATRNLLIKTLKKHCKKNVKILDAGSGTGGTVNFLKKAGFSNISCLEKSPEAIKFLRKRKIRNIVQGSINDLPFEDNSFDIVICLDVLYHKGVVPGKVLKEFNRVLKREGIIYLQEPAYNWLKSKHDKAIQTRHRFNRKELISLVNSSNFEIIKSTYFNSFLLIPIILKRFLNKIPNKNNHSDVVSLPQLLNFFLKEILFLEIKMVNVFDLPFGLSIVCVAKKVT